MKPQSVFSTAACDSEAPWWSVVPLQRLYLALCVPLSPFYLRILFQPFMSVAAPLAHRRVVLVTGLFVLAVSAPPYDAKERREGKVVTEQEEEEKE